MTDGEIVIGFIERHCCVPEGKLVGKPIRLEEFQKKFILDVYDNPVGTSTAYLCMARKNGKTALIACLVLAHLVSPIAQKNSQIVSGALSRDQAALVFSLAEKMVRFSEKLSQLIKIVPSSKKLVGLPMNVEYKALAAEGKTAHGLSPILAILDEIGQVRGTAGKEVDFIDAILTAQGAHEQPMSISISTQAADPADLLSVWLQDARVSSDPHIVSHVYAADEDAAIDDENQWAKANPALGKFRSYDDLKRQAEKASRMPTTENRFRNLCLNQMVATTSPFVSRDVWSQNGDTPHPLQGMRVYGGLDLSARTDLTSFVMVGVDSEGNKHVHPYFWTPEYGVEDREKADRVPYRTWVKAGEILTTPGKTVDYGHVAMEISKLTAGLDLQVIAFDRWRIDVFKRECDSLGIDLPLKPFGQGFKDMSPALDVTEGDLLNGRLRHGMHPVLTMCAANAIVNQDPAGNRKLDKDKATGRIDGMQALCMAQGAAASEELDIMDIDGFLNSPVVI